MRRSLVPIILLGLACISTTSSYAQRGVAGKTFILDDGSGNTLTLEYLNVPPVLGNSFYNFLPGGGAPTPAGSVNGQTLWWNNTTNLWVSNNFLTNTGSAIGIGTASPIGLLSNTTDNNWGSDARGINPAAFTWVTNTGGHGYAASVTNEGSGAGGFDGLLVRVWDNHAGTNALDVSQGAVSPSTTPTSLLTVYGNGDVNIDPTIVAATSIGNSTAATNVNITSGNKWSITNAGALTTTGAANIATTAGLTNYFGNGGGTTTNNIGNNGTNATQTTNNIGGTGPGSANMVNGIGFNDGSGSVVNQFGVAFSTGSIQNQIGTNQGTGTVTNYWGTSNHTGTINNSFGTSSSGPISNTFGSSTAGSSNTYSGVSSFTGNVTTNGTLSAAGAFGLHFRIDNTGNTTVNGIAGDGFLQITGGATTGWGLPPSTTPGQIFIVNNQTGSTIGGALTIANGNSAMFIYTGSGWQHIVLQ